MKLILGIALLIWVYYNIKYIEREDISFATAVKEGMSIIICLLAGILAIMIQKNDVKQKRSDYYGYGRTPTKQR